MPIKISLKKLFVLTCALKVGSSFVGWYLHEPWIFGLLLPLCFMAAYMIIGYRLRDSDISAEKFADSCYYLGFIFTIASIIFSLFDLPNIGTDLTAIAVRFGAAMVSTVLGLAVRVTLVSFRPSTDDALSNVEDQVIDASRKLADEFQKSLEQLVDFRADVMRATDETVTAVKEQILAMSEAHQAKTTEFFATMAQHNKEMMLGLMQDVRTTALGMTQIITEYEAVAKDATERIDQSVVTFADGLVTRLDEIQFPDDLFSNRLEGAVTQLGVVTETATDSLKSVTLDVQGSARLVNNSIKRINEKLESMGSVLDDVHQVGASLEVLTKLLQTQQEAVLQEMGQQSQSLIAVVDAQQESLNAQLGSQLGATTQLTSSIQVLAEAMGQTVASVAKIHQVAAQQGSSTEEIKKASQELVATLQHGVPQLVTVVSKSNQHAELASQEHQQVKGIGQQVLQSLSRLVELSSSHLESNSGLARLEQLDNVQRRLDVISDHLEKTPLGGENVVPFSPPAGGTDDRQIQPESSSS